MLGVCILCFSFIPNDIKNLRNTTPRINAYQNKPVTEKVSLKKGMQIVMRNGGFMRMGMSITLLYFVLTGIQFWFTDFLISVMKMEKSSVFVTYGVVSISGPVFGVITGGQVSSKLGGYNNPKSIKLTALLAIIATIVAVPIPYLGYDFVWLQITFLWLMLFCGGMILPAIMGVMLNSVSENLKTTANSIANSSFNLFGFLPAPYVYGLIADSGEVIGGNKLLAMKINMTLPALFALLITW